MFSWCLACGVILECVLSVAVVMLWRTGFGPISSKSVDFIVVLVEVNLVDLNYKLPWGRSSNLSSVLLSSAGLLAVCSEHAWLKVRQRFGQSLYTEIGDPRCGSLLSKIHPSLSFGSGCPISCRSLSKKDCVFSIGFFFR